MYHDDNPIEVTDEVDVQDLTDVKKDRNLFPATKDLKVRINKASSQSSEDKDIKSLNLELRVVDGIPDANGEASRIEAPIFTGFMDLVYWAKLDVKGRSENKWWKNNQHVVGLREFCEALDIPLAGIKVNDQFLSDLLGHELLVTIRHEEDTQKDQQGKKVKLGTFSQKLQNWKKVA